MKSDKEDAKFTPGGHFHSEATLPTKNSVFKSSEGNSSRSRRMASIAPTENGEERKDDKKPLSKSKRKVAKVPTKTYPPKSEKSSVASSQAKGRRMSQLLNSMPTSFSRGSDQTQDDDKPPQARPSTLREGTEYGMPSVEEPAETLSKQPSTSGLPSMAPPPRPGYAKSDHTPKKSGRTKYRQKIYKFENRGGRGGEARLHTHDEESSPDNPEVFFAQMGPDGDVLSQPVADEDIAPGAISVSMNNGVIQFRDKGHLTNLLNSRSTESYRSSIPDASVSYHHEEEFNDEEERPSESHVYEDETGRKSFFCTKRFQILLGVALVAVIVIVVFVKLTAGGDEPDDDSESSTDLPPVASSGRVDTVQSFLSVISGSELLNQPGSPQNLAYDWIVNNDQVSTVKAESLGHDLTRMAQRYALAVFFFATGGETTWTSTRNWLSVSLDECEWKFVVCNDMGEVVAIDTSPSGNGITGELPGELGILSTLETISLRGNSVEDLPMELGRLNRLSILRLDKNKFEGTIPSVIYELGSLESLIMGENSMIGTISPVIANLSRLRNLDLFINRLTGTVPSDSLASVQNLVLASNNLDGDLSQLIMGLRDIVWLDMSYNSLVGKIPSGIGQLPGLETLILHHIELRSSIPTEIGLVRNLTTLALTAARLTGTIPTEMENLKNLENLQLLFNDFSGEMPAGVCTLRPPTGNLEVMQVDCSLPCVCCSGC